MPCRLRIAASLLCVGASLGLSSNPIGAQQLPAANPVACEASVEAGKLQAATRSEFKNATSTVLRDRLGEVRDRSFPELAGKLIKTRPFESSSDYFRTRVSISRFLLFRPMQYIVEMNPRIADSSPNSESVCAILAHELVHITGMSRGNRMRLLGMIRLASPGYTAKFERSADLEAIRRGYGEGLIGFREWVYKHIPAGALKKKRRNYFSPEEISAILRLSKADPALLGYWKQHVPLNLGDILRSPSEMHKMAEN